MASPYAIALHATAQDRKQWPEENWIELGRWLQARTPRLLFPWGNAAERARSERIVAQLPHGRVPDRRPIDAMARLVAGASFVVGVDTGILHLAAALGVPLTAASRDSPARRDPEKSRSSAAKVWFRRSRT